MGRWTRAEIEGFLGKCATEVVEAAVEWDEAWRGLHDSGPYDDDAVAKAHRLRAAVHRLRHTVWLWKSEWEATETQAPAPADDKGADGTPEYHYAEVMDCGHFMEVVMFVPMPDRSVLSDLDLCHLCKEEGRDFLRRVTLWRLMEPQEWQGTATPCPDGQCGPVEDASDYPGAFPMLGTVQIAPYQLGRCARCGQYYQWNVESQRWDPWREEV